MIKRGSIYWLNFSPSTGSELRDMHPVLVIQATHINKTMINTVVVVGISSNLTLQKIPGNALLKGKETGLPKDSVVNVSQIFTVDKSRIGEYIGSVQEERMEHIFHGIDLLFGR